MSLRPRRGAATTPVRAVTRRKPARKQFPAYLPRERVVVPGARALQLLRLEPARRVRRGRDHLLFLAGGELLDTARTDVKFATY